MTQQSWVIRSVERARQFLLLAISFLLCLAQIGNALPVLPPAKASTEQLLQMKEKMTTAAERIVKGKLLTKGLSANEIAVNVEFDFDKEKLRSDSLQYYQSWYESQLRQAAEDRQKSIETQKSDIKAVAQLLGYDTEPPKQSPEKDDNSNKAKEPLPQTNRLGSFNLDLLGMSFPDPVNAEQPQKTTNPQPEKAKLPFTLGIQLTGPVEKYATPPTYTFDLADYLTDVRIELILPTAVPNDVDADLRKSLATGLGIKSQFENKLNEKITITRAPPPKEVDKPSYVEELFKPQSPLIPAVAASVIAGTLLLAAAFLLLTGLTKLATGLSELKPKEQVAADGIGKDKKKAEEDDALSAANNPLLATPAGSEASSKAAEGLSDPNALSRMFAADMPLVRSQISEIVKQDPNAVAEIIRDIANAEQGLGDMKDFVTFVGFEILRPALDALPQKLMQEFSASIEDDDRNKFNPLNGIELAQRVNRDFLARSASRTNQKSEVLKKLRKELLLLDNDVLATLFGDVNDDECTLLLKTLSLERAQAFFKKIQPEVFRNAYLRLDEELTNQDALAKSLTEKVAEAKKQVPVKGSVGQKRVMLRILKTSTPEDEEFIQSLVASDDWEMKSLIMKTKFLFRDLPYVQQSLVKLAFESFPLSFRGELFYCSTEPNKKVFLDLYPESARARELLNIEVSQIEKNDKRRTSIEKNKNVYIQKFLEVLHQTISADPANFEEIMLRIVQNQSGADPQSQGDPKNGNGNNAA
ncbi:MAG: hypothetical protein RIR26_2308 [Pseudomonadota bacterium]|jgi:hypothetical protein